MGDGVSATGKPQGGGAGVPESGGLSAKPRRRAYGDGIIGERVRVGGARVGVGRAEDGGGTMVAEGGHRPAEFPDAAHRALVGALLLEGGGARPCGAGGRSASPVSTAVEAGRRRGDAQGGTRPSKRSDPLGLSRGGVSS